MEALLLEITSSKQFSKLVEEYVQTKKLSYLDAILECCAKLRIEEETAAKLLTPTVKLKLKDEALKLKLISTRSRRRRQHDTDITI